MGGLPGPGPLEAQSAKQIEAFGVLTAEMDLIQGYFAHQAELKSSRKQSRHF